MTYLVALAIRRPYTFVIVSILIVIFGLGAARRMPTDILPEISVPVIGVVWQYSGLPPDQMNGRILSSFQRALTTTVNDIESISATSYTGSGIVRIHFHPNVNIATANAQVAAISQYQLKFMPPGTTPPLIINYNASTVSILQLALSGEGLSEQDLGDIGQNRLRVPLVTVPGAAIPYVYGGKVRQVQVDLDPVALRARHLSAKDVVDAFAAQNVITPAGYQKIADTEYVVNFEGAPQRLEQLSNLPIKTIDGAVITVRDVAQVRDGSPPQTNVVHVNGDRSVIMSILKAGNASTLDIIAGIKTKLAEVKDAMPDNLKVALIGDQSPFVRGAMQGVALEAAIAAVLTSTLMLVFLGSWRPALIVAVSIPLSILGSILLLGLSGETLNMMTMGGLALAVGMLVDEATVTVESITRHLEFGKDLKSAILDGAAEVAGPALVSLMCICVVLVPIFFLPGIPGYLFSPLAKAVIFAMVFSFLLSRTLVPTMANYLFRRSYVASGHESGSSADKAVPSGFLGRACEHYRSALTLIMRNRTPFAACFAGFVTGTFLLTPHLGVDFFPSVDAKRILMHVRAKPGTRIEETAAQFNAVTQTVRSVIPPEDLDTIADNIGLPVSVINLTYQNTGTSGPNEGDMQIALKPEARPTRDYVKRLREVLPAEHPDLEFAFLPADIVNQILNFGAPAPIEIQVRGAKLIENFDVAWSLSRRLRRIGGLVDVRVQESPNGPGFNVHLDRSRAAYVGVNTREVADSLAISLAGSGQVAPSYFVNPDNRVSYPIVIQAPSYWVDSLASLTSLPVAPGREGGAPILGGLVDIARARFNTVLSEYNIQPIVRIYASLQDRDLGSAAAEIETAIAEARGSLPKGSTIAMVGQTNLMRTAFEGLGLGILGAIVLIYLLTVVSFQSWTDPLVIVLGLPAALSGIIWMLFVTHTPISVPALTGAIMCIGVATANSVLVISAARDVYLRSGDPVAAALSAGAIRFRPVLMTATAMMIGMLPMSLGLGEGGEQNAPLGRAVIGGLLFATIATLFLIPVLFSLVHRTTAGPPGAPPEDRAARV